MHRGRGAGLTHFNNVFDIIVYLGRDHTVLCSGPSVRQSVCGCVPCFANSKNNKQALCVHAQHERNKRSLTLPWGCSEVSSDGPALLWLF